MSVKIVVVGANGLLGRAFVDRLARLSSFNVEQDKALPIGEVVLFDIELGYFQENPSLSGRTELKLMQGNLCDETAVRQAIQPSLGIERVIVYLFAAVLSGTAENNFDLGINVNLKAPMAMLEVMRDIGQQRKQPITFVYTSSDYVACFNDENRRRAFSEEGFRLSPASYGVQKACMELLVCDYVRRGFLDGRVARISAMIGRPGFSNSVSSAYSMIFTQSLLGKSYKVPLPMDAVLPCSSLENNVDCLLLLGGKVSGDQLGHNRVVQLPACSYSLSQIWTATQQIAKRYNIKLGDVTHADASESGTTFTQINVVPEVDCRKASHLGLPQDIGLESIILNFLRRERVPLTES